MEEFAKCLMALSLYVLGTLYEMLVNAKGLHSCAAPLDVWIIAEFVLLFLFVVIFFFLTGYELQKYSWMNLYAIAVWNVGGFAMLLYAESKSPECLPEKLKVDMKIVLFSMALIAAVFLISVMWAGGTAIFHSGTNSETERVYERLSVRGGRTGRRGTHEVYRTLEENEDFDLEGYIRERGDMINSHAMRKSEIGRVKGILTRRYEQSSTNDGVCPICIDQFDHGETVLAHPICHHNFHIECLETWLGKKANCPLCRRGSRSGLMIEMKNNMENELGFIQI